MASFIKSDMFETVFGEEYSVTYVTMIQHSGVCLLLVGSCSNSVRIQ